MSANNTGVASQVTGDELARIVVALEASFCEIAASFVL